MDPRRRLALAGVIGATCAYIFSTLATTGTLNFIALAVFLVVFVGVSAGFERFIAWAVTLDER